jgi:hypothetical protein
MRVYTVARNTYNRVWHFRFSFRSFFIRNADPSLLITITETLVEDIPIAKKVILCVDAIRVVEKLEPKRIQLEHKTIKILTNKLYFFRNRNR